MKIPIDREKKLILLKWLQKGVINTNDMPELNDAREHWFLDLMKETNIEEEEQEFINNKKLKQYGKERVKKIGD